MLRGRVDGTASVRHEKCKQLMSASDLAEILVRHKTDRRCSVFRGYPIYPLGN